MATVTDADPRPVALLDTSAAVALIVEDHDAHAATLVAVRGRRLGLAGHAWFETYSVLTRLPAGLRRAPADALRLLVHNFPASGFLGEAEAVYDALVAAAARQHRLPLLSANARARPVHEALGVEVELIPEVDPAPDHDLGRAPRQAGATRPRRRSAPPSSVRR